MSRFGAAFFAAILAGCIAHDLGVPWWRDWDPGDAADIATVTGALVFELIGAMRATVIVNNISREPVAANNRPGRNNGN